MKTYNGNITTKRYPRATWDHCTRHPGAISGPHRPVGRFYTRTLAAVVAVVLVGWAVMAFNGWVNDLKVGTSIAREVHS